MTHPAPRFPMLPEGERWVVRRTSDPEEFEVVVSIVEGYAGSWGQMPAIHERGVCRPYADEIETLAAELMERRAASRAVVGSYQVDGEMERHD